MFNLDQELYQALYRKSGRPFYNVFDINAPLQIIIQEVRRAMRV